MLATWKLGSLFCNQANIRVTHFRSCWRRYGKMSRLYRPANVLPPAQQHQQQKSTTSKKQEQLSRSQKLMLDNGLIQSSSTSGTYHLLQIATKSLDKLIGIIDKFMVKAECQKIRMPILASSKLWSSTGRLDNFGPELMTLTDRHQHRLVLCPTHEEVICELLALQPISHRGLPLRLYQITEKFRDEKRPRFGLLRGREFLMKDLYSFDVDQQSAEATYEEMNRVYAELLNYIGVKFAMVEGSTGLMGGKLSHEFHLLSDVGEDKVIVCNECQFGYNQEVRTALEGTELEEQQQVVAGGAKSSVRASRQIIPKCSKCGSTNTTASNAIEVAHSFLLGTKYSEPLQACFHAPEATSPSPLWMGCYGIGVTRLLAAVVEVLSTEDEIRWPLPLAPYLVAFVPPKEGSKEEQSYGMKLADKLATFLIDLLPDDLLVDDRKELTIGRRLKDVRRLGIPYAVVCGKQLKDSEPQVELIDIYNNSTKLLDGSTVFRHLYDLKSSWTFV